MSPQHQKPGANAEAAAAREGEAGPPPESSAPGAGAPSAAAAPEARAAAAPKGKTTTEAEPGTASAGRTTPEAESAAPAGESAAPAAGSATTEAPREGVAVAAAVGTTPPGVRTDTAADTGRPRKPVLAGAAIVGAALIAIPLLLAGTGRDDTPPQTAGLAAEGSDTVLNQSSAPASLGDYVAEKPSSTPSEKKEKPKKEEEPPKAVVVAPPPPAPEPEPSKTAEKKAKPKPKPKPSPKPDWSTETVYATSVLEVNQAWTTNRIRMVMQTDGNLVVYNEERKPIWASMTFGPNHRAIFQEDGNLVIHNGEDRPIWAAGSYGHQNAQLVLRADAKVVILHNGNVIWST
ncbi:mannose-binding protein [Streptomyces capillispiralis]|uniref:mannose-binding protein n=1 Tax=Streptomyces capillispiralis TaxID=68182 RepID=UPI0036848CC8